MKAELKTIVTEGLNAERSVDRKRLNQYTHRRSLLEIEQIPWESVWELHILGTEPENTARYYGESETGCFLDDTEDWVLVLGADAQKLSTVLPRCGPNLKTLDMRFLTCNCVNVSQMPNLELMRVSMMSGPVEIRGIEKLKKLQELDLSFTDIGSKFNVTGLKSLRILEMTGNTQLDTITGLYTLGNLEELDLSGTAVTKLNITTLKKLKRLRLMDTRQLQYVEGTAILHALEYLDFSCSAIKNIPDGIQCLGKLKRLDLSYLTLEKFPPWLTQTNMQFTCCGNGINLCGAAIPGDSAKTFVQEPEQTPEQFHHNAKKIIDDWNNNVSRPMDEVRVVFLGDGMAGKSHIIARLRSDGGDPVDFTGDATPGVSIHDKLYSIQDRSYRVHLWDFGGQKSLYSMHRVFLSTRTLYVVVVDVSENTQQERAQYWLNTIRSFAEGAPVLLVLNQMDKRKGASVQEENLRDIYFNLTEVVQMSAKEDSQEQFVEGFLEALKRQIGQMQDLDIAFPPACYKLKNHLQNLEAPCISRAEYDTIADHYGVDQNTREHLLEVFNDLGISYYHPGLPGQKDYIVLQPDWIANAIAIMLFNRHKEAENGMVARSSIQAILQTKSDGSSPEDGTDELPLKRILKAASYTPEQVEYVLDIMHAYWLSFPLKDGQEFIPMLCSENRPSVQDHDGSDVDILKLRMKFSYLPDYLIHRLMVEMRGTLDRNRVWCEGASFSLPEHHTSAEIFCEKSNLEIVVRGKKPAHGGKVYLNTIREAIERIADELNLPVPETNVLYHAAGKEREIPYLEVVSATTAGETDFRIWGSQASVPMHEFLEYTCAEEHVMQEELAQRLQTIFLERQTDSNRLYIDTTGWDHEFLKSLTEGKARNENERESRQTPGNTPLIVSVVRFDGVGEMLDIRREAQIPWAHLATVCIGSGKQDQINSFDQHLKEMLEHCIPRNIPCLVHISQTDCDLDQFDAVQEVYADHLRTVSRYVEAIPVMSDHAPLYMASCTYDCDGIPTKVLHILTRETDHQ